MNSDRTQTIGTASRAWYGDTIDTFRNRSANDILGQLATHNVFDLQQTQRDAWLDQTAFLRSSLAGLTGSIFFEFAIPRMGRRIDVVLLIGPVVFVVEFKVGASTFDRSAIEQCRDYALDLKNFHESSHAQPIVPILVATEARRVPTLAEQVDPDAVYRPICVNHATFRDAIEFLLSKTSGPPIDPEQWLAGSYRPTPTTVEAARALYAQHSVESIARHDAGAENLRVTKKSISDGVKHFIQDVHHIRDEAVIDPVPPAENVAVFDEAQRAWNLRKTATCD